MGGLCKELSLGLRSLARRPAFSLLVIATLALGVGTNATIFSAVYAVLLKRLPFEASDRMVAVEMVPSEEAREKLKTETEPTSWENYLDWKSQNTVFDSMAGFVRINILGGTVVSGAGQSIATDGCQVTPDFFPLLGIKPLLGRLLEDGDHNDRVAVLSCGLWERLYGGKSTAIGQTIRINAIPHTIVGVTPAGFRYDHKLLWMKVRPDIWVPLDPQRYAGQRGNFVVGVLARLKPGITLERAGRDMSMIGERIRRAYPDQPDWAVRVSPVRESLFGHTRPILLLLFGAVGLVLLIACANTATLLLSRTLQRQREIATRLALGARRFHLVLKLAAENFFTVSLGGFAGLVLAFGGTRLFNAFCRDAEFDWPPIEVNLPVIAFGALVSLVVGAILSLLPLAGFGNLNLQDALRQAAAVSSSKAERRLTRWLVVAEVALSLILVVGASVVVRSFLRLYQVNTGLRTEKVLTMAVSIPGASVQERVQKGQRLLELPERVGAIAGVESAASVTQLPGTGAPQAGMVGVKGKRAPSVNYLVVSNDYFRVMGIDILNGRSFVDSDVTGPMGKTIISRSLAEQLGEADPVGLELEGGPTKQIIIGVVADVRQDGLTKAAKPQIYLFDKQMPRAATHLVVRSRAADPLSLVPQILKEARRLDPELAVSRIHTMDRVLASTIADRQITTMLMSLFTVVALLLATVGLGGVMSDTVSRRTREMAVRMALGARTPRIMAMVLKEAMTLAFLGIVLGMGATLALIQVASSRMFGLAEADAVIFALASSLLLALSFASAAWPALRASRTSPVQALRQE